MTGQMIAYRVYKDSSSYSWRDGVILFILYIMCNIIRAIVLFPLLSEMRYMIHDINVVQMFMDDYDVLFDWC